MIEDVTKDELDPWWLFIIMLIFETLLVSLERMTARRAAIEELIEIGILDRWGIETARRTGMR